MSSSRNERRWRNRTLVRERDVQRARTLWVTLALFAAALTPAGVYLYEQNSCLELSYEIDSIDRQREDLDELERRLEVRHAGVASMHSIERWAAKEKYERPTDKEIVVVPHGEAIDQTMVAGVPQGSAKPAAPRPHRFE